MKTTNSAEITVAYRDGRFLVEEHACLVDTIDKGRREMINKQTIHAIDLRFLIPPNISEEFLAALRTGQIYLTVEGAKTILERVS